MPIHRAHGPSRRSPSRADWLSDRRSVLALRHWLLILTVIAVAAAGCSGAKDAGAPADDKSAAKATLPPCPLEALNNATGPVEVVLWHFLQAKPREALEQIAATYNASQTKVKVRVENQGSANEELWDKYRSGIRTRDLPGIAVLDDTVSQQIIDSQTVLPAQSCIDADHYDMSDFLPGAKSFYTKDGVLYPATLSLSGALLYYNKNHFIRAGLDPNTTPRTLDEVRDYARKIKAAGVVDKPVVLQVSPSTIEMFLTGDHSPVVDNDNGRGDGTTKASAYDNPETVKLYTWFKAMIDEGLMDALPQTPGQVGQYLSMAAQKSSMTIETSTAATSIEAFLKGDLDTSALPGGVPAAPVDVNSLSIGAGPIPGMKEPGKLAMGGGAWYITNTTAPEVQAAAWDFTKFFNETKQQATWNAVSSYLPYRMSTAQDPQVKALWSTTLSGRWMAIAYDELVNGIDPAFPGPRIGPYDLVRKSVRDSVDQLIFNAGEPAPTVKKASDDITAVIEKYNKENF